MESPTVAVIIAALEEADTIGEVIDSALAVDFVTEVIIADGGSTDGTVDLVERRAAAEPRLRLIHNPHRHQSAGLNLAAAHASADILVRLDAHTGYADDYLDRSLQDWRPGRAVGGPMRATGTSPWTQAIANAMADPWAIGPARFRHASRIEEVDTVYLGMFERSTFLAVGGFRTFPSGAVEDTDFYARWREHGWSVVVDPEIRSTYHPRRSWKAMWGQYERYGVGKAELLWVNGRLPSTRALAPAILVAGLAAGGAASLIVWPWSFVAVAAPWLTMIGVVGARAPTRRWRTALAAATMQLAYGVGTWHGVLRGRPDVQVLGLDGSTTNRP